MFVLQCLFDVALQAGKIMITYETRLAQNVRWVAWALITVSIRVHLCLN